MGLKDIDAIIQNGIFPTQGFGWNFQFSTANPKSFGHIG